jgi:hypothetical protein
MRGAQKAQPFGHPLDGRVRRQPPKAARRDDSALHLQPFWRCSLAWARRHCTEPGPRRTSSLETALGGLGADRTVPAESEKEEPRVWRRTRLDSNDVATQLAGGVAPVVRSAAFGGVRVFTLAGRP